MIPSVSVQKALDELRREISNEVTSALMSGGLPQGWTMFGLTTDQIRGLMDFYWRSTGRGAATVLDHKERKASDRDARDARRYRRLQILGCAPTGHKGLDSGTVLRFTGLDEFLDADIRLHPSRGENPGAVERT